MKSGAWERSRQDRLEISCSWEAELSTEVFQGVELVTQVSTSFHPALKGTGDIGTVITVILKQTELRERLR